MSQQYNTVVNALEQFGANISPHLTGQNATGNYALMMLQTRIYILRSESYFLGHTFRRRKIIVMGNLLKPSFLPRIPSPNMV